MSTAEQQLAPTEQQPLEQHAEHVVMKFGGSSVSNKMDVIIRQALASKDHSQKAILAISAFQGQTDSILKKCNEIKEWSKELKGDCIQYQEEHNGEFPDTIEPIKIDDQKLETLWEEAFEPTITKLKELLGHDYERRMPAFSKFITQEKKKVTVYTAGYINSFMTNTDSSYTLFENILIGISEKISGYALVHMINEEADEEVAEFLDLTEMLNELEKEPTVDEVRFMIMERVNEVLEKDKIPVIPGYIGNWTRPLYGRGYTDTLAGLIAAGLLHEEKSVEMQYWKDFAISSADPKLFTGEQERVQPIQQLSKAEVAQLIFAQMKALNAEAFRRIAPLIEAGATVVFKSTADPDGHGTEIRKEKTEHSDRVFEAIALNNHIVIYDIAADQMIYESGWLERIGKVAKEYNISIRQLGASSNSVLCTFDHLQVCPLKNGETIESESYIKRLASILSKFDENIRSLGEKVGVLMRPDRYATIVCVGEQLKNTQHVSWMMEKFLEQNGVFIEKVQSDSEITYMVVVKDEDKIKALHALHELGVEVKLQHFLGEATNQLQNRIETVKSN